MDIEITQELIYKLLCINYLQCHQLVTLTSTTSTSFDSPSSKTNHKTLLAKATPSPNNNPAAAPGVTPITPCPANDERAEAEKLIASLKQQLHEKEMGLTDVRLEALSSAHMQEQLRETINQLKVGRLAGGWIEWVGGWIEWVVGWIEWVGGWIE